MPSSRLIIGCGYLGERVARRWLAEGCAVHALTRSPARAEALRRAGLQPLVGDVTDLASLPQFPDVETLLYAVGLDRRSGRSQREVYVTGLANVLPKLAGQVKQAIYVSSTSVYGQSSGEWVDELSECRPQTENGHVCLEAERLFREAIPQGIILRLAGLYGPGRLAGRIESLRAGLPVEGNPEAYLNLIHVDDAVAAVLASARRGIPGSVYLVSDSHPCRRLEYYSLLAALVGAPRTFARVVHEREEPVSATGSPPLPASAGDLNKRCSNRRLRDQLQVVLRFPKIQMGLPDALTSRGGS